MSKLMIIIVVWLIALTILSGIMLYSQGGVSEIDKAQNDWIGTNANLTRRLSELQHDLTDVVVNHHEVLKAITSMEELE